MKATDFIPATAFFLLTLILFCLAGSALSSNPFLTSIHADKWVHILLFGLLCYLFNRPFSKSHINRHCRQKWFLAITLMGIVYGIMMEFVQKYWVANRSFELGDILADAVGCWLAFRISTRSLHKGQKIGPDGNRDRNQN